MESKDIGSMSECRPVHPCFSYGYSIYPHLSYPRNDGDAEYALSGYFELVSDSFPYIFSLHNYKDSLLRHFCNDCYSNEH